MTGYWVVFEGIKLLTPDSFCPLTNLTTADNFLQDFLKILQRSGPQKSSIENFSSLVEPRVGKIVDLLEELGQQFSGYANFPILPQAFPLPRKIGKMFLVSDNFCERNRKIFALRIIFFPTLPQNRVRNFWLCAGC